MKFGCKGYQDKVGILLAQVGTPDAADAPSLRRYLKQFLGDRRVIEVNRLLWWFLLNFIILNTRPKRSAAAYARIWRTDGSPLLSISNSQVRLLRESLVQQGLNLEVEVGMGYGKPAMSTAIDNLIARGVSRILLLPMFPQYAAATSASAYDAVFKHLLARRWVPTLRVVEPYYLDKGYISALATRINEALLSSDAVPDYLLLSFHGLPLSYVEQGDPYCCMCTETYRAVTKLINFPADKIIQCYQSRFGKQVWLTPYTDETVIGLAKQGATSLLVAAPGFTTDCLETLDELGNELRHTFIEHGGRELRLVPCLNDHASWIQALTSIVKRSIQGWETTQIDCGVQCPVECEKRSKLGGLS